MAIVPAQLDFDRAVRGFVKLALNVPVIPANANFPAPTGSYATALLMNEVKQGFDFNDNIYNSEPDNIRVVTSSNQIVTYSIQVYRDTNVLGMVRLLQLFCGTPSGRYYLQKNNMTIIDWSNVRNLTTVIDSEMEPRASVDLTFGMVFDYSQDVERINSVDVNTKIETSGIIDDNLIVS